MTVEEQFLHHHSAQLIWTGNLGTGTSSYVAYGREYTVSVAGKPDLFGSAHAAFRGDSHLHDPEDLFLAAISACHMLTYLALCARRGIRVLCYEDRPRGTLLARASGGGGFQDITLAPVVTVASEADCTLAAQLHDSAHEQCFIANSCSVPISHEAIVRVAQLQQEPIER